MNKQEQIDRIINQEILTLANATVEVLFRVCPDEACEIENEYAGVCPECGEDVSDLEEGATEEHEDEGHCYTCPYCKEGFSEPEQEGREVMQWWIVSDWLAGKLREQGEVIWEPHDVAYWGRCGCGYSLEDETCIKQIAENIASPEASAA